MVQLCYVDGAYIPLSVASVGVEDRGYQFADSVYEVIFFENDALIDAEGHLERLKRSLDALDMPCPLQIDTLYVIMRRLIRKNNVRCGMIYIQITRGSAPRSHSYTPLMRPHIVVTLRHYYKEEHQHLYTEGVEVITAPDIRWGRVDIKTTGLLANVLAKQEAKNKGAFEAWFIKDGYITEGCAANAWIVDAHGACRTHPATTRILDGITKKRLTRFMKEEAGLDLVEKPFTLCEAMAAQCAFLTSATALVIPVVRINGKKIGAQSENIHPVVVKLQRLYKNFVMRASHGDSV